MSERAAQLLEQLLEAQYKTNSLLIALIQAQEAMIQALGADEEEGESLPQRDLAGRLIR